MRSIELQVDVSAVPGGPEFLQQAVTVHLPDQLAPHPVLVYAFPGATYSRQYFDLSWPGVMDESYSQAVHHCARGVIVVACDHLGTGQSSLPADPYTLEPELLAEANAAVVADVGRRLSSGALAPDLGPIEPGPLVGFGQSMGGCLLTVQQARHRTFEAIGILGWSGCHTTFPDPGGQRIVMDVPRRGADLRTARGGVIFTAEQIEYCFHHEAEGDAVIAADLTPGAPWRSAGVPPCSMVMLSPGVVAEEAASIDVPVLVVSGERDVIADPHSEALAYQSSPDVTVRVFPQMGHMHNFAPDREQLWDRLLGWISSLGLRG